MTAERSLRAVRDKYVLGKNRDGWCCADCHEFSVEHHGKRHLRTYLRMRRHVLLRHGHVGASTATGQCRVRHDVPSAAPVLFTWTTSSGSGTWTGGGW